MSETDLPIVILTKILHYAVTCLSLLHLHAGSISYILIREIVIPVVVILCTALVLTVSIVVFGVVCERKRRSSQKCECTSALAPTPLSVYIQ